MGLSCRTCRAPLAAPKVTALDETVCLHCDQCGIAVLVDAREMLRADAGTDDPFPASTTRPREAIPPRREWYVAARGERQGPMSASELIRSIEKGEIDGQHHAWHSGMSDWRRVADVPELAFHLPAILTAREPPPIPAPFVSLLPGPAHGPTVDGQDAREATRSGASGPDPGHDPDPRVASGCPEEPAPDERPTEETEAKSIDSSSDAPVEIVRDSSVEVARDLDEVDEVRGSEAGRTARTARTARTGKTSEAQSEGRRTHHPALRGADRSDGHRSLAVPVRESTRFFVAAAGVTRQRAHQQIMKGVAVAAAFVVVSMGIGLATGVVQISIPTTTESFFGSGAEEETTEVEAPPSGAPLDTLLPSVEARQRRDGVRRRANEPSLETNGRAKGAASEYDAPKTIPFEFPKIEKPGPELQPASQSHKELEKLRRRSEKADDEREALDAITTDGTHGGLSPRTVSRVAAARMPSVDGCYQRAWLPKKRSAGAKLQVRVTIQPSGIVSEAVVAEDIEAKSRFGECIVRKVRGWRFPSFAGSPMTVLIPFVLDRP